MDQELEIKLFSKCYMITELLSHCCKGHSPFSPGLCVSFHKKTPSERRCCKQHDLGGMAASGTCKQHLILKLTGASISPHAERISKLNSPHAESISPHAEV